MKPLTPPEPVVQAAIRIDSHLGEADERSLAEDVLDGLTRPFKELPPKHFYDARGAELFDHICELPEYYPTRAERSILEEAAERSGGAHRRRRARRARLGHGGQDARAARRDVRGRHAQALHPGGRDREHGARLRRGAHGRVPGASGARRDRRLRASSRPRAPGRRARASSRSSAARSATSRRAAVAACCARSPACSAPRTTC